MYGTCGRIDNKADFDFDFDFEKNNSVNMTIIFDLSQTSP